MATEGTTRELTLLEHATDDPTAGADACLDRAEDSVDAEFDGAVGFTSDDVECDRGGTTTGAPRCA